MIPRRTSPVVRTVHGDASGARGRTGRALGDAAARHAVADWLRQRGHATPASRIVVRHRLKAAPIVACTRTARDVGLPLLSISHIAGAAAAVAGDALGLGIDLVEARRFERLAGQPEQAILQRRLVGTRSPALPVDDLRRIAAVKEAVGKAIDARASGLAWLDVVLRPGEPPWPRRLEDIDVDGFGSHGHGTFAAAGLEGAWGWWVRPDGTGLAVAVR